MMTLETGRLLGTVRTEFVAHYEDEGAGSRGRRDYRPVQTPLLNDGRWHHWMRPGEDYEIRHDGTGWRVTCGSWSLSAAGHVYRLASASTWELADRLPVDDAEVVLDRARVYVLRSVGVGSAGAWTLHQD